MPGDISGRPRRDPWCDALDHLLSNPELCERLGSAGRRYVEANHRWDELLRPLRHGSTAVVRSARSPWKVFLRSRRRCAHEWPDFHLRAHVRRLRGGAFRPFVGLLIYFCFAILKPDALWSWSVPPGNYSRTIAICAGGVGHQAFRRLESGPQQADRRAAGGLLGLVGARHAVRPQ